MENRIERFFDSREKMQQSLLANTEYQLERAIQLNGHATMMLSGGSTPKPLYQSLANSPIAWSKVTLGMVDERWVAPESEASNEKFIRLNLLNNLNSRPEFLEMKIDQSNHFDAVKSVSKKYEAVARPFDVTILGMGNDGHTASLFPHAVGLYSALTDNDSLCAAITANKSEVTGEHLDRMTLTLNAIKKSRVIKLLLTGDDKLKTYQQALAGNDVASMPIRAVLQQNETPVVVYWAA